MSEFTFTTLGLTTQSPKVDEKPQPPIPAMEKVEPEIKEPIPATHTQMYVAPNAPKLIVKIPRPDGKGIKQFQFLRGQLTIPNEFVSEFDKLIKESDGLRPLVKKVDLAAAKRMVAELEAKHNPTAAAKGTFSTSMAMQKQNLENINAQMEAAGVGDKTYVDELGGASMQMLEVPADKVDAQIFDPKAKPQVDGE